MAFNMKEVAFLRGNDDLYQENLSKIDFSAHGGSSPNEAKDISFQMTEETTEVAKTIAEIIDNAPIKKDPSILKCSNTVLLNGGEIEVSHRSTGNGMFEFMLLSKKQNVTVIIDEDTIFTKTKLPLLAESFVGLYFEALKMQNKEHGIE